MAMTNRIFLVLDNPSLTTLAWMNTTGRDDDCPQATQSVWIFYLVLSSIFISGIVGNSLLILIFARQPTMRTAPNTYILSLAVADLVTILGCASSPLLHQAGLTHPLFCKVLQTVIESSYAAISFTLVALSVERYNATAQPLSWNKSHKRYTVEAVVLIWLASTFYTLGKTFFLPPNKCAQCVTMFNIASFAHISSLIDLLALYVIPLLIIATCYVLMALKLYSSAKSFTTEISMMTSTKRHVQARKRTAKMVLILVAMFTLCYFPFHLLKLVLYLDTVRRQNHNWTKLASTLFCIGCLHTNLNPVVLYSLSKSFREHFNKYLFYVVFASFPVEEDTAARKKSFNPTLNSVATVEGLSLKFKSIPQ